MKNNLHPLFLKPSQWRRGAPTARGRSAGEGTRAPWVAIVCATLLFGTSTHAGPLVPISADSILSRTRILASDEFEGRSPGTPGEEKTVAYIMQEFKKNGLAPGNPDGTFFQNVPLVGITSKPTLSFDIDGKPLPMTPINDFVGPTSRPTAQIEVKDSDVVFVGYGVVSREFDWDDYKGIDVRGKTVVVLINDPPVTEPGEPTKLDPTIFGGNAMTYYGRWTYKYEIAARKGAAACLIVHETGPAAYPFAVVVGSRSRENFELRTNDANAKRLSMEGWLTLDAAKRLFTACGRDFDELKKSAAKNDFYPTTLGAKASFTIESELRNVDSKNVVAKLEGTDPKLRNEYIIYTAHWDHLGRDPNLKGDQIFNGAADNAAGVSVLLELAQSYATLPHAERPKRSILFLSVTAEEKGLLGARYYAQNPLYPLAQTLANINMDGANQFGRTSDIMVVGHGVSTIDDIGAAVAKTQGRDLQPDTHPERGGYYRSDHFEFAKVGVPSYYPKSGRLFIGKPAEFGEKIVENYIANDYHKVTDEVKPDWTFEGAAQDTEFLLEVGLRVANGDTWPEWRPGNEFKARRDAMLRK